MFRIASASGLARLLVQERSIRIRCFLVLSSAFGDWGEDWKGFVNGRIIERMVLFDDLSGKINLYKSVIK